MTTITDVTNSPSKPPFQSPEKQRPDSTAITGAVKRLFNENSKAEQPEACKTRKWTNESEQKTLAIFEDTIPTDFSGWAQLNYRDGTSFVGDFINGMRDGIGTLTLEDRIYIANWDEDAMHGVVEVRFIPKITQKLADRRVQSPGVETIDKRVVLNQYNPLVDSSTAGLSIPPSGQLLSDLGYHDGIRFIGRWDHGVRYDKGISIYPDDSEYAGEFKGWMRHGHGEQIYPDGSSYKGWWQNDKQHGSGVIKYADGSVFLGNFVEGQKHGKGTLFRPDRASETLHYENGILIPKSK